MGVNATIVLAVLHGFGGCQGQGLCTKDSLLSQLDLTTIEYESLNTPVFGNW